MNSVSVSKFVERKRYQESFGRRSMMCVFCCTNYNGVEMEKKTVTFENSKGGAVGGRHSD